MMIQLHIILAIIALITGPLGLSRTIRMEKPILHRWNGRIYVIVIVVNILPGYYIALYANGGHVEYDWFLHFKYAVVAYDDKRFSFYKKRDK
ncbi:DUF2306 domain-containing protein [Lysinibacillus sp. MHQ-1]|nr:DUF2306 domain-containing protein [Lysinibacillus sp. MHQ-1]